MSAKQIKDVMIPVEEYVTVQKDATLLDLFLALEEDRESKKETRSHAHRDVLVVDGAGDVVGKVTMLDIIQALEPGYRKMKGAKQGTLTADYVSRIFEDMDLWAEPLTELCTRKLDCKVSDIMHEPAPKEKLAEEESLERAVHHYVMGVHQPLLAVKGGKVTGVVRLGDIFELIHGAALACKA